MNDEYMDMMARFISVNRDKTYTIRFTVFLKLFFVFCIGLMIIEPVFGAGQAHTIGDVILKTDQLRNLTGADGSGIGIGIISNGAAGLIQAQESGDLPQNVIVLMNGRGSEGTAMMEIIHDIAPGAPLLYHDFGGGAQNDFIYAIESLIDAGARIIVDDVGFLQVPYFEDGYTAQNLNRILDEHPEVILVSAAGNNAEIHYQAKFSDDGSGYHSFDGMRGIPIAIQPGGMFSAFLQWDDMYGNSANDYNLYLEENGELIALSERIQDGSTLPEEKFTYINDGKSLVQAELRIKKENPSVEDKNIELFINAQKDKVYITRQHLVIEDSIIGQAAVPRVLSVAAISPEKVNSIERYSSQGFVTISYPESTVRQKPDITGINNVAVSGAGGFPKKFPGTSAAAPHIAGLLALEWSLFPSIPADDMRNALLSTALELGEPGWDPAFGYGLPDAIKMYEKLQGLKPDNPLDSSLAQKPVKSIQSKMEPPVMLSGSGEITGPVIITSPGTYTLGKDIVHSAGSIITIMSSDVTIQGGGKRIEGLSVQFIDNTPIDQNAILIQSPDSGKLKNIVIRDMVIEGTTNAIIGKQLEKLHIDGCTLSHNAIGIGLYGSDNGLIENCLLSGNSYKGLAIKDGSSDNLVKGNTIEKNLYGIDTIGSVNTILEDNIIRDNRREDIYTPKEQVPDIIPTVTPTGIVPCPDANYDGICDDPNGTPQPTKAPTTSSVPFSYSEEISMTTIYTYPTYYPTYYPTHYPTPHPTSCWHC
jgi:parallel beta-helix repeat protein